MVSAAEQLAANLNFSALAKADELKKRIWFTLGALLVLPARHLHSVAWYRSAAWAQIFNTQAGGIFGMFNMFSGGGIHGWRSSRSTSCLHLGPIIIQLMTTVSPQRRSKRRAAPVRS